MDTESEILQDDLSLPPQEDFAEKLNSVNQNKEENNYIIFIFPFLLMVFLCLGLPANLESNTNSDSGFREFGSNIGQTNFAVNILSESDLSMGIKDTVYTDKDAWLELRIDQQMLYQHWRDGHITKYAISTGNKFLSRSIESRPGLFAIFVKEERHESSQYHNAAMYYFMPFNMGIGFHSLDGTGYYGNLGVRPSSHGCIRMRHEDVKRLFKDSPLGTLVLAHRGYSARTVGFAPKDFQNSVEFSKDEVKKMLAENLVNVLEGNYYVKERKFFIVDPKVIPVSGVYISYDRQIPDKQKLNICAFNFMGNSDWMSMNLRNFVIKPEEDKDELAGIVDNLIVDEKSIKKVETTDYFSDADLIKKYFHNPIGILPYFPPNKD